MEFGEKRQLSSSYSPPHLRCSYHASSFRGDYPLKESRATFLKSERSKLGARVQMALGKTQHSENVRNPKLQWISACCCREAWPVPE